MLRRWAISPVDQYRLAIIIAKPLHSSAPACFLYLNCVLRYSLIYQLDTLCTKYKVLNIILKIPKSQFKQFQSTLWYSILSLVAILIIINISSKDYWLHPRPSGTVLHGLVIHLDGGHGMVVPAHLHLASLLPLLLIVQPAHNLISVRTIPSTCKT